MSRMKKPNQTKSYIAVAISWVCCGLLFSFIWMPVIGMIVTAMTSHLGPFLLSLGAGFIVSAAILFTGESITDICQSVIDSDDVAEAEYARYLETEDRYKEFTQVYYECDGNMNCVRQRVHSSDYHRLPEWENRLLNSIDEIVAELPDLKRRDAKLEQCLNRMADRIDRQKRCRKR